MKASLHRITDRIVCLLLLVLLSLHAQAQMLETVDFSPQGSHYNNYTTAINNKGCVTGYYTLPSGTNIGFIITGTGKKLVVNPLVIPALSGYTDTKVTGINNHYVASIYASNGSGGAIFKAYIDSTADTIANIVAVGNIQQPSSVSFQINDYNDITGWFQASTRFLFVVHDSITPSGCTSWEGDRYYDGTNYYNTFGSAENNSYQLAGYYVNAPNYCPFVYDNLTHTFNVLNTGFYYRLYGINNNNLICGDYKQGNGFYMAFYATYNPATGSMVGLHSLSSIFLNNTVTSVAMGINDNGDIVGNFTHPSTGASVGFIYHTNVSEYRIPGYAFANDTWTMLNSNTGTNAVWDPSYYVGANYDTYDPYAQINTPPLVDSFVINQVYTPGFNIVQYMNDDTLSPSWKGYATETDILHEGTSNIPFVKQYYANITKHLWWNTYRNQVKKSFKGYCYGFAYTSLLHHFDDAQFSSWFGMPVGSNIYTVQSTNSTAVMAVERAYLKQFDQQIATKYPVSAYVDNELWGGEWRLKTTYRQPLQYSNPRAVSIGFWNYNNTQITGYHEILPYKIHTPTVLPFDYPAMQYDTMFIYDSNYPGDSSQYFTVKADIYAPSHDSAFSNTYPNLAHLCFAEMSLYELYNKQYSAYKTTNTSPNNQYMNIGLTSNLYYTIQDMNNAVTTLNSNGFLDTSSILVPVFTREVNNPAPDNFTLDTSYSMSARTYQYQDSVMNWSQSNTHRSQTLSRAALPGEQDFTTMKNRFISYGNHDAVTKSLSGAYTENTDDHSQGSSILVAGICAAPGDSIVTKNPYPYAYQVIRLNGQSPCTYTLTVFASYGDTVKEFHAVVDQQQNSSHIIDPYYTDQNGTQHTVIYVDNGNTGTNSDTLFIAGWPVDLKTIPNVAGISIRPNPVYKDLNIDVRGDKNIAYHVYLMDIAGRIIYSQQTAVASGTIVVPMGNDKAGLYILQIANDKGETIYRTKITKE